MARSNIPKKAAAIAALQAKTASPQKIAKAANVSQATLYNWRNEAKVNPELEEAIREKRNQLAAKMEALAAGIADKLLTDLESVTWDNKAGTVLGIATDKWLALTGQAQTITENRVSGSIDLTVEARRAVQMYISEGFTPAEAVASLQDDDPELYRAYLSASHRQAE